jgi:hypothetical protein
MFPTTQFTQKQMFIKAIAVIAFIVVLAFANADNLKIRKGIHARQSTDSTAAPTAAPSVAPTTAPTSAPTDSPSSSAPTPAATPDPAQVKFKPTAAERVNAFSSSEYVIDLLNGFDEIGAGGSLARMNLATLPALEFQGVALTLIYLKPCGLNTPHIHPRASEAIYNINGTNVLIAFAAENGANFIQNNVTAGKATFIPQGALHFEQNLACDGALLIAANNSEDQGTLSIGTTFFNLPDITVEAITGFTDANLAAERNFLPKDNSPVAGVAECLQRCGISA